ncbi:hypothetical protein P1X16_04935 [Hymenobacter sp. YC55]|nr:hypothetical protein [Hymenobacter sp. YC55]
MGPALPAGTTVAAERVHPECYSVVQEGMYVVTLGPVEIIGRLREEGVRANRITLYFDNSDETCDVLLSWDPEQYRLFRVLAIIEDPAKR